MAQQTLNNGATLLEQRTKINENFTELYTNKYGGFCTYEKAVALAIVTQNKYHAYHAISAGDITADELSGWTFYAGRNVDANITSEADNGSGLLRIVTSAVHGLITDDVVTIVNANNAAHNAPTKVTQINTTTFDCQDIPYVAGAGASAAVVDMPAYLQASAGSDGMYHLGFNFSFTGTQNKVIKVEMFREIEEIDCIAAERMCSAGIDAVSGTAVISITEGDRMWIGFENLSGVEDIVVKHANAHLHRI